MTCAVPPLDQSLVRVGRGYGIGWDRGHNVTDQLHAGMDFDADEGSVVVAPISGQVVLVSDSEGPPISAARAKAGERGQVRGFSGYGNVVVLQHDVQLPGMPARFWTTYNHLQRPSELRAGQTVNRGDRIGYVGNTTNGRFRGMGAHLHLEVRRREPPGSYNYDTINPEQFFNAAGIDWVEKVLEPSGPREGRRFINGRLLVRAGGPSDPATCRRGAGVSALSDGLADLSRLEGAFAASSGFAAVPPGYVDPASSSLRTLYASRGTTSTTQTPRVTAPEISPPDYPSASGEDAGTGGGEGGGGGAVLLLGAGAVIWFLMRR